MRKICFARLVAAMTVVAVMSSGPLTSHAQEALMGEMRLFATDFCPYGFEKADGRLMNISGNTALFSLLGTVYGGDSANTFALPDLRGRAAVATGQGTKLKPIMLGQSGGSQSFTVDEEHMGTHIHAAVSDVQASSQEATQGAPANATLANPNTPTSGAVRGYDKAQFDVDLRWDTVQTTVAEAGGQKPISKQSPFLGMTWCIAIIGAFPHKPPGLNVRDAYVGEMRLFAFSYCPGGFAEPDGKFMNVNQANDPLFYALGAVYGGDGGTYFALPDLRGRTPIGTGKGTKMKPIRLGQQGGSQTFTMNDETMATHVHAATSIVKASSAEATQGAPADAILANPATPTSGAVRGFNKVPFDVMLAGGSVVTGIVETGGQMPISKQSPFLGMTWCIATKGLVPVKPTK